MSSALSPELRAQATQALEHQKSGRYAEAAQGYAAVLSRAPDVWQACYNLGIVYQHLNRLPEAAEMYARAVRLNPQLAEGYNNLGNVLKILKNDAAAIEAYQQALALNAQLPQASYNLATMLQARGELDASIAPLRLSVAHDPTQRNAWDALYRGLLGLGRQEEAIQAFLDWERAESQPSPEIVTAGLALCRPMGDREREARYLRLAIDWPFAEFSPESLATVIGMLQYFDLSRDDLLSCYRHYDAAISARNPAAIALLPRRSADSRLRIGYVSADFRKHVMGRMMLEVISRHDRSLVSILLISTCPRNRHDAITAEFRNSADGFADVSELDDFAAAKSIAEADIDVLVDLAGHTMDARPGIYAHRPARTIVTHLGYHGCLGLSAVDCKLTDRLADRDDAAQYQIEHPYFLDTCVFPLVRGAVAADDAISGTELDLSGKFVFGAFVNLLKLSSRCLDAWKQVLDAVPEAILLFSPFNPAEEVAIQRLAATAGIERARIVVMSVNPNDAAALRARYRVVNAVMDTFPYAGGDTTLAALDMGVPVVTLCGDRHSERIGASILGHLGLSEMVAATEEAFVATCVRLARDPEFMAQSRLRIAEATKSNAISAENHVRSLERAYADLVARKPVVAAMALSARQFYQALHDAMRRQHEAANDVEKRAIATTFVELRNHQPEYAPLLRAQAALAQDMNDLSLAADCLAALLKQSPDDVGARLTLAGFLIDQGAATDALTVLDDVPASQVIDIRILKLRTRAHIHLRQWKSAHQYSAAAIDVASADSQALFWHGTALSHVGESEAALTFLNRALILSPDHAEAAYTAGVILFELGNHTDAEKVFRRALGTDAAQAAHLRLLQLLHSVGRQEDWHAEAIRFAKIYGGFERAQLIESRIARHEGNLEREAEIILPLADQMAATDNDGLATEVIGELLTILPYHDVSPRLLQRLRTRFKEAVCAIHQPLPAPEMIPADRAGAQFAIGYLVDFSLPLIGELVTNLATHHDRQRFSMTIYVLSPSAFVPQQALLDAGARVVMCTALDEQFTAERIRADGLDLLVDASSGGTYAKTGILSHRPVAVQISLPGLSRAAGIGDLDGRISDHVLDLDEGVDAVASAPWFMDGCAIPALPSVLSDTGLTRDMLGVTSSVCVFGVLASAERISMRGLTLWKAISEHTPEAVFLIFPQEAVDIASIQKMLLNSQIAPEQIRLLPPSLKRTRKLALRGVIDVILDTLPGSDYDSAMTSLIEGIPLVTMPGRMPEERIALSLMTHLGETATVAASGRDYVDIATKLATDPAARDTISAHLQSLWQKVSSDEMAQSMRAYTRRLEDAYVSGLSRIRELPAGLKDVQP